MLRTSKLNMAKTITPDDVNVFLDNVTWAICSTYHTVLKVSPGATIFRRNMLFDIPFIADCNKIRDYKKCQTDLNTACKNSKQADYDYIVGNKVLLTQEGILHKAESPYSKKPWTITTVHTNGTIRIQHRNIRRVTPLVEEYIRNSNYSYLLLSSILC
jgi:hypothetical protein